MPITKNFKETIQARAIKDEAFREGLLRESIECMLSDDMQTGKALLRDYINATTGFEELARMTHKNSKSVMRMLSSGGNPTANNLFDILHALQKKEGVHYELQVVS
jgi:DNA-binding phage protein